MTKTAYDIVCVGGGLGGSALAAVMSRRGATVLVLEREQRFGDRVRGEALAPWGLAEARRLGLEATLQAAGGHALPFFEMYYTGAPVARRDVVATTPQAAPWLAFSHPRAQQHCLEAAMSAGAEVRRGVRVCEVTPAAAGNPPKVAIEGPAGREEISARLIVGADGRGSLVRRWCGFEVRRESPRHLFAGVLLDDVDAADDASYCFFDSPNGRIALLFPQGGGRARGYVGHHRDGAPVPAGEHNLERFLRESVAAGVPPEWYARAKTAGPLAMFDATDNWVEHPYRDGVALVGDAAATSDPTWGQGMSMALRDVRTLADLLQEHDDWDAAGHAYAAAHDANYDAVRTADGWFADVFMAVGAAAEERRAAALPLIAADPTRIVDVGMSGPEVAVDDAARRRFFGEE